MSVEGSDVRLFRFGPRVHRGLVGNIGAAKLGVIGGACVVAIVLFRSGDTVLTGPIGLVVVFGGLAFSTWPIAGKSPLEWMPTCVTYLTRSTIRANGRIVSSVGLSGARHLPSALRSLHVIEVSDVESHLPIGVVVDRRGSTWTAVLSLQGESFSLLSEEDQQVRASVWSSVLAAMAHGGTSVHRLQWIERTVPDRSEAIKRYAARVFSGSISNDVGDLARRSYEELLVDESRDALRHEVFLAVSILCSPRGALGRLVRPQRSSSEVLRDAVLATMRRCQDVGISVRPACSADEVTGILRSAYEPVPSGLCGGPLWPIALETSWSSFRTDATWHATYWIAEWPRSDVHCDFLSPLLSVANERRSVAVIMASIAPQKAVHAAERARTTKTAEEDLRLRHGFSLPARSRREHEAVLRHESELSHGHVAYRFSGYVTVTGSSSAHLEQACSRIEQAAAVSRLDVRRLYGLQAEAFCLTLPTGRGCL